LHVAFATRGRTFRSHRSGSTRVSSSRSTSTAVAPERPLQRRQTAERIIAHGYRRGHLHDRLLAASREARAAQAEGGCAVFDRALCAGVWRRPTFIRPMAVAGKLSEPRRLRRYLRRKLRAPKASASGRRVGRDGHFTNTQFLRARNSTPHARSSTYFIATMACAEDDGLNVFGCSRLAAGIGFLRLPASSTSGVTGVLTYPRKQGGA
jgi:hypothetical protein